MANISISNFLQEFPNQLLLERFRQRDQKSCQYNRCVSQLVLDQMIDDGHLSATEDISLIISTWLDSNHGQWCMANSVKPMSAQVTIDLELFRPRIKIVAWLTEPSRTEYLLRWR